MTSTDELLDDLMKNCKKHGDLTGESGLLKQLSRLSLDHARQAGLTEHAGYPPRWERK
jgi:hypothetical protein